MSSLALVITVIKVIGGVVRLLQHLQPRTLR